MNVKFFCPRWGSENIPFLDFIKLVKEEGYDGVEISLPDSIVEQKEYLTVLADYNVPYIIQHWQTDKKNVDEYISEYTTRMEMNAHTKPLFINSQTGKDFFSFEDNCRIIEKANEIESKSGVPVFHETHRGKFSFACHVMPKYLEVFPEMKITADFSHWVNVSESLLDHQQENLDKVIPNVYHIHSRVGHTQGAQVNDPELPENKVFLDRHFEWWDAIIKERKGKGDSEFTITPEFGPAPYMPLLPFTQQPISNQWKINKYMMKMLKSRYKI
jgi:sugar phosphate isomerase/epimerase